MTTEPDNTDEHVTYGSYLAIDELLSIQRCRSTDARTGEPEHDEMLFIIVHQVYELWFKQILHELDALVARLDGDAAFEGGHQLKRVLKILKTLVAQLDVLETMTPLEFASFRSFLATSSGFQSVQFRELEFLLGQKSVDHLRQFEQDPDGHGRLSRRYEQATLWDAFVRFIARRGFTVPVEVLTRDVTEPVVESPAVQAALIEVYKTHPNLTELCEALTDLDEGIQEWRYRHVMMVQRTIGTQMGTGGSDGAAYLRTTLFRPVFPDLWAIRAHF